MARRRASRQCAGRCRSRRAWRRSGTSRHGRAACCGRAAGSATTDDGGRRNALAETRRGWAGRWQHVVVGRHVGPAASCDKSAGRGRAARRRHVMAGRIVMPRGTPWLAGMSWPGNWSRPDGTRTIARQLRACVRSRHAAAAAVTLNSRHGSAMTVDVAARRRTRWRAHRNGNRSSCGNGGGTMTPASKAAARLLRTRSRNDATSTATTQSSSWVFCDIRRLICNGRHEGHEGHAPWLALCSCVGKVMVGTSRFSPGGKVILKTVRGF